MPSARSLTAAVCCLVCLVCPAPSAGRAATFTEPLVDAGLAHGTPVPDADLVLVRERSYGAQAVDLTPFGIGSGADDYVQSIYLRFYAQAAPGVENTIEGTVTFPPGVTILGFITAGSQLGSSTGGGPYTASDALFAVAANPDDYVAPARGFETPGTGPGSAEFVCQIDERSFYFGLDVLGSGADDLRVIVDYGGSFAPGLTFEVNLSQDRLNGVPATRGIRVGQPGGTEPGAADYGEITHLMGVPLTTDAPPVGSTAPPVSGRDLLYLVRETGGDPEIDGFDTATGAVMPDMVVVPPPFQQPPRAIAFGEDGLLYVQGSETGLAAVDTKTGDVFNIGLPDLPGAYQRMAAVPGDTRLFILRQTSFPDPEDAWVDTYDTSTGGFTPAFATFPTNLLPYPVDLIAGGDGRLYALGTGDAFHEVNLQTGAITPFSFSIPNPPGDYVRGAADPFSSRIYLLRDTTGPTFIDRLDTTTGAFTQAVFTLPDSIVPDAGALAVDNAGRLWVFSKNGGALGLEPAAPAAPPFFQTRCLDFPGFTNYAAVFRSPREVSPPPSSPPLLVRVSPDPSMLRISWEDLKDPGLLYNVYAGEIGSYYSHAPAACHLPPAPEGPGYLFTDVTLPAGNAYYLVTASSAAAEGSAGPRPISAAAPACGPSP